MEGAHRGDKGRNKFGRSHRHAGQGARQTNSKNAAEPPAIKPTILNTRRAAAQILKRIKVKYVRSNEFAPS